VVLNPIHNFNKAGLPVSETSMIDERNTGGKKLAVAVKANLQAMACFTMTFTKACLLLLAAKAKKTAEWPIGLAYLVVEPLKKKYMPDDQLSKVEARKALNKVSMKSKEDPTVLIEKLRMIKAMYMESTMVTIDETEMIAVVMDKTRADYKSILTTEIKRDGGGTLDDLEELLHLQWRALYGTKDDKAAKNGEDNDDDTND
jgi:hypothetical protein